MIAAVCAAAMICGALVLESNYNRAFREFWSPMWAGSAEPVIAIAHPLVYRPSDRVHKLNEERLPPQRLPIQRPIQLPPQLLDGSDMIPIENHYVGFGDAVVAAQVNGLLAAHQTTPRLRFATKVEFADLRESPALLIGAFTNKWTLEFCQNFRFRFQYDSQDRPALIEGTGKSERAWNLREKGDDGTSSEDYFLVARLMNSPSGKPMIIAAGLTQVGTEAAGNLITNSAQLESVLKRTGADWRNRNLEMVLHSKIIGNAPSPPELIAWYAW